MLSSTICQWKTATIVAIRRCIEASSSDKMPHQCAAIANPNLAPVNYERDVLVTLGPVAATTDSRQSSGKLINNHKEGV